MDERKRLQEEVKTDRGCQVEQEIMHMDIGLHNTAAADDVKDQDIAFDIAFDINNA